MCFELPYRVAVDLLELKNSSPLIPLARLILPMRPRWGPFFGHTNPIAVFILEQ